MATTQNVSSLHWLHTSVQSTPLTSDARHWQRCDNKRWKNWSNVGRFTALVTGRLSLITKLLQMLFTCHFSYHSDFSLVWVYVLLETLSSKAEKYHNFQKFGSMGWVNVRSNFLTNRQKYHNFQKFGSMGWVNVRSNFLTNRKKTYVQDMRLEGEYLNIFL